MGVYAYAMNARGGLFGDGQPGPVPIASIAVEQSSRVRAAKALGTRSAQVIKALATALNGAAPGATATYQFPQIDGSTSELGGKRPVNQVVMVNRATTSADVTEINNTILTWSTRTTFAKTPPINKDQSPLGEQR